MITASIHIGDIGQWFSDAWPWVWPSLLLVVWFFALRFALSRWRRWITAHQKILGQRAIRIAPSVLRGLERLATFGLVALGGYAWTQLAPIPVKMRTWTVDYAEPWVVATAVFLAILLAGLYGARRLIIWLEAKAAHTAGHFDDIIVEAIGRPLYVTVVLLAVNLWASMLPLPLTFQRYVAAAGETTIVVLVVLFIDGLIQSWMLAREENSKVLKTSGVVLRTAARILAFVIGGLMAMSSLGFNVTPALATLGIGSAALGFALQGTVTDFLAGLMIAADQPIRVGDFILLDTEDHQGWVLAIGWRATRLLTRFDMEVSVPNSRLASAVFVNTSRPREDCRFQVTVPVVLREDLDKVTALVTAVAEDVQREDPRAFAGYRAFTLVQGVVEGTMELRVWLCAVNFDAYFGMKDAYLRRVHRAFREAGLQLAFPSRTLDIQGGLGIAPPAGGSAATRLARATMRAEVEAQPAPITTKKV